MAESPIKVSLETKQRIRLAAAIMDLNQKEVVDRAICELIENHKEDLKIRVAKAQKALLGTDQDMLDFMNGKS